MLHQVFSRRARDEKFFNDERLVMLCDGIFAIAITLLVIDIRFPPGLRSEQAFDGALLELFHASISYLITFIVIASFWREHHRVMHDITCIDANFISLTFLFLLFIAFFPVTCSIIRESDFPLAIVIYVLGFAACGFSLWFLWLYASWHHSLIDPEKPQLEIVARSVHLMLAPTYFSLSLLLLFVLPADHGSDLFWSWLLLPLATRVIRWVLNYIPWFKRQQEAMQAHLPAKNEQVRPTR